LLLYDYKIVYANALIVNVNIELNKNNRDPSSRPESFILTEFDIHYF